jgi:CMP-N,N'-diacetyllegionaminic acid synthase
MTARTGKSIALIPARSGSKRVPLKNIRLLNGVPLIAYTIAAAQDSKLFSEIIVSTDSSDIASIARKWGAKVPKLRPKEYATDESSDIEWVMHSITEMISTPLEMIGNVAILRPTSPLRRSSSIKNAMHKLNACTWADSIRGMELTSKHPGKMWILGQDNHASSFLSQTVDSVPTYNQPTQSLQKLWVQNASLEIAKIASILKTHKISGDKVLGLELPEQEGFDLNTETDWEFLEFLIMRNPGLLPKLEDFDT